MDTDAEYSFRYFSPSIVQGEPHEFCLEYSDAQGTIMFSGLERDHHSGGTLYFLSEADWNELYPTRKGQRELITARVRKYCRSVPRLQHLDRLLGSRGIRISLPASVGRADLTVAVGIALLMLVVVAGTGDPLQFGLWYYLLIPALLIGAGIFLEAPSPYLTGASLASMASLLIVWNTANPGGPTATGHLFSLPLALGGFVVGLIGINERRNLISILALGVLGWGSGFLITQLLLCRGHVKFLCQFSIFS